MFLKQLLEYLSPLRCYSFKSVLTLDKSLVHNKGSEQGFSHRTIGSSL